MRLSGSAWSTSPASPTAGVEPAATGAASGALTPERAAALLVRQAGEAFVRPDPGAVQRLVRLCGHLPPVVGLAAALLRADSTRTVTTVADDLDSARDRFPGLTGEALAVAAAFDLSYRDLPVSRRRLLRYLGLHPGPDFDVPAAAALGNLTLLHARRSLADLRERHLLIESGARYRFPDLIAEHVHRLAVAEPAVVRDAALGRLHDRDRRARARRGKGESAANRH
ncbi:hypothetical protein Vqi01_48780 [Micromonospora qiuiae]|uniref:Uncharacterized protein n=1 Tax=Micromonospora qiuiae TaxID=502268 RepID=A0ABQ4JGK3_9ACTN|nr:hypothetical protein [Micromonospora qiuiae]GIJ29716.1 hypothetical protein Vqi01_48780 [Micromonospora qiuiae]